MKKVVFIPFLTFIAQISLGQFSSQLAVKKYDPAKVIDPDYGITMYEKLSFYTGGDSIRNDKRGYTCQGWQEDLYESGAVLHKGYYEDGHLRNYKNFYENGTVERSFKLIDFKHCNLQIFYPDGKLKSDITYYEGNPQVWIDYYKNGQIEYSEENTKDMQYLVHRKSYKEDGKPEEIFELVDPKKKRYLKQEYDENGAIKAEGPMKYNTVMMDYQKDGIWKIYDETGKITEEKWVNGERQKPD